MIKEISILFLGIIGLNGCSVYGMTRPKSVPELVQNRFQSDEYCTSSVADPIADTAIALGAAILTGLATANALTATVQSTGNSEVDRNNLSNTNDKNWGLTITSGLIGAAYLGSAIYGYNSAEQCSETKIKIEKAKADFLAQELLKKKEADESARKEALARKEREQQDEMRREHEAFLRQEESRKLDILQKKSCEDSFQQRKDSEAKLNYHNKIELWVAENCKDVPNFVNQQYVDFNGLVRTRTIQNGTQYLCPTGSMRPKKINGGDISDVDIKLCNFATNNDDVNSWNSDIFTSKSICFKFDKE